MMQVTDKNRSTIAEDIFKAVKDIVESKKKKAK